MDMAAAMGTAPMAPGPPAAAAGADIPGMGMAISWEGVIRDAGFLPVDLYSRIS